MSEYPVKEIEERWQKFWAEQETYKTPALPKRKYYILNMYPYPSGDMHLGHARTYCIGDVIYRFRRMQGYDVLHPVGFDAFGLPAENAAIKHGNHPCDWTYEAMDFYRKGWKQLGMSYDWSREVATCEPDYYRWNQWMFLKFYERGLAYRKEAYANWCPGCQTVLANEQVKEGVCERCKSLVEKRKLTQWFFKITDYAQRLLDGLDTLPHWPENVKAMQRNWIGRSEGCEVDFILEGNPNDEARNPNTESRIPIFTTRPDTLYGVTFMALAADAPLAETIAKGTDREAEVREFCQEILKRPEIERIAQTGDKQGIFTGKYAINPLTGDKVPIYIADFVLASYGTGMIMAVPAHDQRDFEFARKYKIPIKVVIQPAGGTLNPDTMDAAFVTEGVMANSGQFDGTPNTEGIAKVTDFLVSKNWGRRKINYRLKDWLISRQRFWGTPIPMIHCPRDGVVPVPEADLPLLLPEDVKDFKPKGKSVLACVDSFCHVTCPKCGGPAERDPDTMDTFVDSSWYYVRYTDPHNQERPFDPDRANAWLPVDLYVGGIEHATGHLIFFRFFHKVLHDMGMLATDEPVTTLHTHGMVSVNGVTMSSSKGNGVWVGNFVPEHGADVARLSVLFAAPPDKGMDWQEDTPTGVSRFVGRIYRLYQDYFSQNAECGMRNAEWPDAPDPGSLSEPERHLYIRLNQTIKKVIEDLEGFQFNTSIAAIMEFLNDLTEFERSAVSGQRSAVFGFALSRLIPLLAPFTPHLAEELWHQAGNTGTVFAQRMPDYDASAVGFDEIEIPIQVNGRLRGKLTVPRNPPEAEIRALALADARVSEYTKGLDVKKVIYVPNRLINIVATAK